MKFRRAQAAMEFLMTYGFALIAILVAIGALVYLGILDIGNFLPERCTFPAPLNCRDQVVTNDIKDSVPGLQLILVNGGAKGMKITKVTASSEAFNQKGSDTDENYECYWVPEGNHHLLRAAASYTFNLEYSEENFTNDPEGTVKALNSVIAAVNAVSSPTTTASLRTAVTGATGVSTFPAALETAINTATDATALPAPVTKAEFITAINLASKGCPYYDIGNNKNSYQLLVHYTWADSNLGHISRGEMFTSEPEEL